MLEDKFLCERARMRFALSFEGTTCCFSCKRVIKRRKTGVNCRVAFIWPDATGE